MFKKNMGQLDRTLRFVAGGALIPIGLFVLGGGSMMSQMMAMCGAVGDETKEEPVAEVNQKA